MNYSWPVLNDAVIFELDKPAAAKLMDDNIGFLALSLPDSSGGTVDLELIKVDIFAPGFSVKTATPTNESLKDALGVHYRGIVRDNEQSLAAISIFKNQVVGFFSTEADGNSVVGRLEGNNPVDTHIVYAEKDLKVTTQFTCETKIRKHRFLPPFWRPHKNCLANVFASMSKPTLTYFKIRAA